MSKPRPAPKLTAGLLALALAVACAVSPAPAQLNLLPSSVTKFFGRDKPENPSEAPSNAAEAPSEQPGEQPRVLPPPELKFPAALAPENNSNRPVPRVQQSLTSESAPMPVAPTPVLVAPPSEATGSELVLLPPPETIVETEPSAYGSLAVPVQPTIPLPAEAAGDRVTISAANATVGEALALIAEQHGLNIVSGAQLDGNISFSLSNVPLGEALDSILTANGYTWTLRNSVLVVSPIAADGDISYAAHGRIVRVFDLNYVSAADVQLVVAGLLSSAGQTFISETAPNDQRRTREQIVVEDHPAYVDRIAQYIYQIDRPPPQVLIEAHILEVLLDDDTRHGVNFDQLFRLGDGRLNFRTAGFADDTASPAFFVGLESTDLNSLIEVLKSTTDAKTLASPKVLALNGQEARIQIGSQLGFFVTTTTQTSTLQSVDFIDVGVVLRVTPIISQDGRVLMNVKPEVSGGRINPDTGLPEEDTTEVETTVMLENGAAMVIGGLIQDELTENQSKIPYLGDIWGVGRLFQRRTIKRQRSEIIVALVPRILPYGEAYACREQIELARVHTPLLVDDLQRVDRRQWEPELRDAIRNPIPILPPKH